MLNISEWSRISAEQFAAMQFDSGMVLKTFDPSDPELPENDSDIVATTGDITANCKPNIVDLGEDVNNVHGKLAELQYISDWDCTLTFTALGLTAAGLAQYLSAADATTAGKITPRGYLKVTDFADIWWVGLLIGGGMAAVHLCNALSTDGLSLKTAKDGKGNLSVTMTGFQKMATQGDVPMEFYVIGAPDTTLSTLSLGSLTLSPTFAADKTEYTTTTSNATNTITATATDSDATVTIKVNGTAINSGGSASWVAGENTVTVTVANGSASTIYTITVTKD